MAHPCHTLNVRKPKAKERIFCLTLFSIEAFCDYERFFFAPLRFRKVSVEEFEKTLETVHSIGPK
jgi:hypothetical protein